MKKLILLLITLTTLTNVSYASFPVTEYQDTIEVIDSEKSESPIKDTPLGNWSLILGLLWFPLLILAFISFWDGPEENAIFFLGASIISLLGSIITGIQSLNRGEKPEWKAIVGLAISLALTAMIILTVI